jgi:hypothetical protein
MTSRLEYDALTEKYCPGGGFMRKNLFYLFVATALLLTACSSTTEPEPAAERAITAAPSAAPPDSLTGTWSGDWWPSPQDRNPVTLELRWDGANLSGTVNPGPNAVPLSRATFNPDTGVVMMEADVQGRSGAMIKYTIQGTVEGSTMTGTWNHPERQGDFKISKN